MRAGPGRRHSASAPVFVACVIAALATGAIARPSTAAPQVPGGSRGVWPIAQAGPVTGGALAEPDAVRPADAPEPVNLRAHTIVFVVGAATLAAAGALQSRLAPAACRWCDLHADGTDALNGFDRRTRDALRWQRTGTPNAIGHVLAFAVAPAAAIGLDAWAARADGRKADIAVDALVISEAVVLTANATELLKFLAARQRPYAHALALGQPTDVAPRSSDNLSFTSGHAAVAFAVTVSAARVASLRRYRRAGWVWGVGLPAAAAVGYFRIAADRHYLTDVLAAAGIGTTMGLIVPRLVFAERPSGPGVGRRVTVAPLMSGSFLGVSCTW